MSNPLFERDAVVVRRLLREHIRTPAPPTTSPLTMGEVACQLRADRAILAEDMPQALGLLALDVALPPRLKLSEIVDLAPGVTLSRDFWRAFRNTAVLMGLARAAERG